ncbi:hypothetical protein LY76DRAFT_346790 [Colletotrichum caudatum]|nr:hypothetical protein LY76DRAFT_346790 [Colletotrichum caudatum]
MDFATPTIYGVFCPLSAIIQYVPKDFGWDLDIDVNLLLILSFLHVPFGMVENLFQVPRQALVVVSLFVNPAVRSLLAVVASVAMMLVHSSPKTGIGSSLKLLSLSGALPFLLLALRRCDIAQGFLVDKLNAKGNLPPLAKPGAKTLHLAVQHVPIDV